MNITYETIAAIAEPNRFQIIELLREKPRPVGEIVLKLKLNQPQVSKHLKVLNGAGLVEVQPNANQRIYKLRPEPFKQLETWIERYRKVWEARFDRLDELLKIEKKKLG